MIESAGKKLAKEVAEESGELLAKKGAGKIASTATKFVASKALSVVWMILTFSQGIDKSTTANICHILYDDVTPQLRMICGVVNMLNETFGILPTDTVFNLVVNALSALTNIDVLNLDSLQERAQTKMSQFSKKTGEDWTIERYNDKFFDDKLSESQKGSKDVVIENYIEKEGKSSKFYK